MSEITGVGQESKKVSRAYHSILEKTDSELNLLLNMPVNDIKTACNDILSEAIRRMRDREVYIKEGFDGEFGQIRVFREEELKLFGPQEELLPDTVYEKNIQYLNADKPHS